jgi:hypothetical protein
MTASSDTQPPRNRHRAFRRPAASHRAAPPPQPVPGLRCVSSLREVTDADGRQVVSNEIFALPEQLQRQLYDAFQLQVRYNRPRHEATIRVTLRAEALPGLEQMVRDAADRCGESGAASAGIRSHVLSAPSRIRTCAHGSGGRCSIP